MCELIHFDYSPVVAMKNCPCFEFLLLIDWFSFSSTSFFKSPISNSLIGYVPVFMKADLMPRRSFDNMMTYL